MTRFIYLLELIIEDIYLQGDSLYVHNGNMNAAREIVLKLEQIIRIIARKANYERIYRNIKSSNVHNQLK